MKDASNACQVAHQRPHQEQFALSWRDPFCSFLSATKGYASEVSIRHWGLRQRPPLEGDVLEMVLAHLVSWNEIECCSRPDGDYHHLPGHPPPGEPPTSISDEPVTTEATPDSGRASGIALRVVEDADARTISGRLPETGLEPMAMASSRTRLVASLDVDGLQKASTFLIGAMGPEALLAWATKAAEVKRLQAKAEAVQQELDDLLSGRTTRRTAKATSAKVDQDGDEATADQAPARKAKPAQESKPGKGWPAPGSLGAQILDLVRAAKGKPLNLSDIALKLGAPQFGVQGSASNLVKHGILVREGTGYVLGKKAS